MYDYEDQITFVVDEQHLNHEPGKMVNQTDNSWDAAIEEALEAAEIPEPDLEMEM